MHRTLLAALALLLAAPIGTAQEEGIRVTGIRSRVVEANAAWKKYLWEVDVHNATFSERRCRVTVLWVDAEGKAVDEDSEWIELACCGSDATFEGQELVSFPGAASVVSVKGQMECVQ